MCCDYVNAIQPKTAPEVKSCTRSAAKKQLALAVNQAMEQTEWDADCMSFWQHCAGQAACASAAES